MSMVKCPQCGAMVPSRCGECPQCGAPIQVPTSTNGSASSDRWLTALLLCFFLGWAGVHRFYVGDKTKGLIMLGLSVVTCGFAGAIWALVDFVMIAMNTFTDPDGNTLK